MVRFMRPFCSRTLNSLLLISVKPNYSAGSLWHPLLSHISSFSVHTLPFSTVRLVSSLGCARRHTYVFVHPVPFSHPDFYKQESDSLPAIRYWVELDELTWPYANLSCLIILIITQFWSLWFEHMYWTTGSKQVPGKKLAISWVLLL